MNALGMRGGEFGPQGMIRFGGVPQNGNVVIIGGPGGIIG